MTPVAVIAHRGKTVEGGLPQLRRTLERHGVVTPLWYEVEKSRQARKKLERALGEGAELIFVWGGDGMVQRCVDVVADSEAALAIVPAGTANLLASNLGVPKTIDAAVEIGLHGTRRRLDVGRINGERFAVMAGVGFDARMIHDATRELKRALGRLAYVWTATKNLRAKPFYAQIEVDGSEWYHGDASCVLFGNVGQAFGGIRAFDDAQPDDGLLEVGVASADGIFDWARTIARSAMSSASKSPFVHITKAHSVEVKLPRKVLYELDGGERTKSKRFRVEVQPAAVNVCVPALAT
jgi:diacylglycerol kinase (ATP)